MTAEIAILNKTAVALAADSAVTISAGSKEEKIFDSADKLFELSNSNPIGIMIYNGMSFMEVPLPSLIRQFRCKCGPVTNVAEIAGSFLKFLNTFGATAPSEVKEAALAAIVAPIAETIRDRFAEKAQQKLFKAGPPPPDPRAILSQILTTEIETHERVYQREKDAEFVGDAPFVVPDDIDDLIKSIMAEVLPIADDTQVTKLVSVAKLALRKGRLSEGKTGIVIAGFGSDELFPTLISFEIDGMICGRLKFIRTNVVDIDRKGPKAQVVPFAQKEMVERFLYGLDERIQRDITKFCKVTVPEIQVELIKQIQFDDEADRADFEKNAQAAEEAFYKGLDQHAFDEIRNQSRIEIEDMVEFMPKPEMAKMAEALVNLTSIKRRVSRGMETVGGPIDVAVISQSEGFVWVKRKHYFPVELNSRYFERVRQANERHQEVHNGSETQPRRAAGPRRRAAEKAGQDEHVGRPPKSGGGNS